MWTPRCRPKRCGFRRTPASNDRARERLVKTARKQGLSIKQSYERVGRRLLMAQSRYAHARQMKRAQACTRKLRTNLGLLIREIERQQ